jgi:hypothetical protein
VKLRSATTKTIQFRALQRLEPPGPMRRYIDTLLETRGVSSTS